MNKKIISLVLFAFVLLSACEDEVTPPTTTTIIEYGSVSGIVVDSQTDEPIAGARVEALLNQIADTTDSLGEYFLDSLHLGDESITVISEFFESQFLEINITPDLQTVNVSMGPLIENQYLYVGHWDGHDLFIIDVDTQEKVDSLYFSEGTISRLTITPGGTKLYIFDSYVQKLFYFDTKTRTFHSTNLPSGLLKFSAYDDQLFLFSDEGIFKVDTLTDVAVQIDDVYLRPPVFNVIFSPTAPVMYFNKRGLVFTYDYQQEMITDSLNFWYRTMAVTPDGKELYFVSNYVGIWDIQNDSSSEIYSIRDTSISIITSQSSITVTPDGDYALITEGWINTFETGQFTKGLITVISTNSHEFYGYIDLKPFFVSALDIIFSRSGRYAYVNGFWTSRIILVDLHKMKSIKSFKFYRQVGPMALGSKN